MIHVLLSLVTLAAPIGVVGVGGRPGDTVKPSGGAVAPAPITCLARGPKGTLALSGSAKGELRRYTLTAELPWAPAGKLAGAVQAAVVLPGGQAFAADDSGAIVQVPADGTAKPFAHHPGGVYSLAVTADGACLLSGGGDGVVRLWRVSDGEGLGEFDAHGGLPVTGLGLSTERLWSVGWDRLLKSWKLTVPVKKASRPKCAKLKFSTEAAPREVTGLAIDAAGERLATSSWDGSLRLWDLRKRKPSATRLPQRSFQEWCSNPVFVGAADRLLAVASAEGGVLVVDRLVEAPTLSLRKRSPIPACLVAVDTRALVGSFDGSVAWVELPPAPKEAK